jgi:hypothetical protein
LGFQTLDCTSGRASNLLRKPCFTLSIGLVDARRLYVFIVSRENSFTGASAICAMETVPLLTYPAVLGPYQWVVSAIGEAGKRGISAGLEKK